MKPWVETVVLKDDRLFIIDQRLLPEEEKIIELKNEKEVFDAIRSLSVRGAPAIGITAAYGLYISLKSKEIEDFNSLRKEAEKLAVFLAESRPTAYNLFYALDRMKNVMASADHTAGALDKLRNEAMAIHREDLERSNLIARKGQAVIPKNARVISHCNAGALATGGLGTSLAVLFLAHEEKKNVFVYVDETRPLLQGSRLTAWELKKAGIPHQVITDNMAGLVMKQKKADLVILGADRIARNGDFANKIGTYSLAVLAHYHGIPFYTAAPVSTFDLNIADGSGIPIEERNKDEVLGFGGVRTAPRDSDAWNPAFDVTPHELVTGIITEYGILYPPFRENIERDILQKAGG